MATQRFYQDMSAEEQLQWVTEFGELMAQHEAMIIAVGKRQQTMTLEGAKAVQRVFVLLAAWPFAQDFCEKAQKYGDYSARTYRLPVYIEKVREQLSAGLTMTDSTGRVVAYVSPSVPLRRRGRPTKEETAARLRGEAIAVQDGDDAETKKRRAIAKMLGLEVIVSGEAPREKNNAELAAERAAKKAMEEKMNPSLFPAGEPAGTVAGGNGGGTAAAAEPQPTGQGAHQPSDISPQPSAVSPCAQLMNDSYEARMAQDKLHLDQLAWLCSTELAKRIATVQSLRVTAEAASERAKTLADIGQPSTVIEPYSQQAKEATEAYLAIYAAVDEELAILHKRLYLDEPFKERFIKKHSTASQKVNIESILHVTRPYYEKMKSPELDLRIRTIIEQENPEYAAKMKAEQEKKEELQQLHRYIMRTDKPASDERVKTMTERIERVRQLAGDEVADSYLPVLEKTKEENAALNKAKAEKKAADKPADTAEAKPRPTKQGKKSVKAASKREQGDAGISHAEREQARRDNGKQESKKATKQESQKKGAKGNKGETPNSSEQPGAESNSAQ